MPQWMVIVLSFCSGGFAGSCLTFFANWLSRQRVLRTEFYPILNNMFSAYVIRMERPEGRYVRNVVGYLPEEQDLGFVNHRSDFIQGLVKYNELKEVRDLRKSFGQNMMQGEHKHGQPATLDPAPESAALSLCMAVLHKRLNLN
jgi:hypothetical protein